MNYLRQATLEDMEFLAPRLREADILEIQAFTQGSIEDALKASLVASDECWIMVSPRGEPAGVVGIGKTAKESVGMIWLMATHELEAYPMTFLRHSKEFISHIFQTHPYILLHNYTDARNLVHHKWLKWCGAVALNKIPLGIHGEDFYEFVIKDNKPCVLSSLP